MIATWLVPCLVASEQRTLGPKGTANRGDAGQTGSRGRLAAIGRPRVSGAFDADPGWPRLERLFGSGYRLARCECAPLGVVASTSKHRTAVGVLVVHRSNRLLG